MEEKCKSSKKRGCWFKIGYVLLFAAILTGGSILWVRRIENNPPILNTLPVFRSPDGAAEVEVEFRFAWSIDREKLRIRLYAVKEGHRTLVEEQNGWFRTFNVLPEEKPQWFKVEWGSNGVVDVVQTYTGEVFRFQPALEATR